MRIIEEFGSLKDNPAKIQALLYRKAYIYPFKDGKVRANRLTLLHSALIAPPSHKGINPTVTQSFPLSSATHSSRPPRPSATS
jgi:hypothetical protein